MVHPGPHVTPPVITITSPSLKEGGLVNLISVTVSETTVIPTLETSGEDGKTTLGTSEEDGKNTLETSGKD
jgi:hypothetical protein